MRNIFLTVGMLFLASIVQAQVLVGPNTTVTLDHSTANLAAAGVDRFEIRVDTGVWTSVGMGTPVTNPPPATGDSRFRFALPTLTPGIHTLQARTCSPFSCGSESNSLSVRM